MINSFKRSSEDIYNLIKSVIMFLEKNIARKLDIAFGKDYSKHHYIFNPPVMLL